VFALMVSIGGQWMLLQGVAWVGMAVSYSIEVGSVKEGLEKTFDGEHPCPLCKAVQKGGQEEGDPADPLTGRVVGKTKAELCSFEVIRLFPPTSSRLAAVDVAMKAEERALAPDVPPPKAV